jgi:hypothetical protein|tara:strand:+ start:194 stop:427 length:234 start_codon:yes stop_codon:yes gene_type:complete
MLINSDHPVKKVKVWGVIEGPMGRHEDDQLVYCNLCKIEVDGKVEDAEYYFDNFDEAYEWVKHFQKFLEPIEIDVSA